MAVKPLEERFSAKVKFGAEDECWEWQASTSRYGHGSFFLAVGHSVPAPRVAWILWRGEIPKGKWILHTCDNSACVNPKHLYVGTAQQNADDMKSRGRSATGEKNGAAKLTRAKAQEIRRRYAQGEISLRTLAEEFGVAVNAVHCIVKNKTWT